MDQNIKNTKPQRSRKKLFLKVSIISVGIFVVPIFFNNSVAQSVDGSTIIETVEIVEPTAGVVEPNSEENISLLPESLDETTVIESGDFTSSLQEILDAPADTPVEFTLTLEENGDNTTTIESGDFASSLQDILDAPADVEVSFTLTEEPEESKETFELSRAVLDNLVTEITEETDGFTNMATDTSFEIINDISEKINLPKENKNLELEDINNLATKTTDLSRAVLDKSELESAPRDLQQKTRGAKKLIFSEERYWQVVSDAIAVPVIEGYTEDWDTAGNTTLTFQKPDGVQVNELLLIVAVNDDTSAVAFTDGGKPSGWTFIGNFGDGTSDSHVGLFWKIADGTEGSTETVTSAGSDEWGGWYVRISGVDINNPINVVGTQTTLANSSVTASAVETTVDSCLALCFGAFDGGDGSPLSVSGTGWSYEDDGSSGISGSSDASGVWGKKAMTGIQGSTLDATISSNGESDGMVGVQIAIAPYAGPVTVQTHYRWRDDTIGLNSTSTASWLANEDVLYSTSSNSVIHLRMQIANTGNATSTNYQYQLEYAERTGSTCGDESFIAMPISTSTGPFEMATTSQYTNYASTTVNVLTGSSTLTWVNGYGVEDPTATTSSHTMATSTYTEFEYAIQMTDNALAGAIYCFRLTNDGSVANFTYDEYPKLSLPVVFNQRSYRFENVTGNFAGPKDDSFQDQTNSADTARTDVKIGERLYLRMNIGNAEGALITKKFKLQFGAGAVCSAVSYGDISSSTAVSYADGLLGELGDLEGLDQKIYYSKTNSSTTLDWSEGTFVRNSNFTPTITISANSFTEVAFALDTLNAAASTKYCFRLYNATDNETLNTYTQYPSLTTVSSSSDLKRFSKDTFDSAPANSDASSTLPYRLDDEGYQNLALNDSSDFASTTKQTTTAYGKSYPQLQVYGSKIYYTWYETDGSNDQIWTAISDLDGSNFTETKQTTTAYGKYHPQLQVYGSKIYYTWYETDGSNNQIWTAVSNLDGTGFDPTKQTTTAYSKYNPQLQVYGSKRYYTWYETDGSNNQIWTAISDLDGLNFTETKQTISAYTKYGSQLQVYGSKIYYTWQETDVSSNHQIWTATSDLDGSNFTETKQTTSAYGKIRPQLQVYGSKIYYTWHESDGNFQIWTAASNLDGTGFDPTKQTTTAYGKSYPQLQVYGSKIYYTWYETDGSNNQIWTAVSNLDGTGFDPTKQTTTAYTKLYSQLQVYGSKIYYIWREYDGSNDQIWTARAILGDRLEASDPTFLTETKQTTTAYDKMYPQLQVYGSKIYYTWREIDGSNYQIWTATSDLDGSNFDPTEQTTTAYYKVHPQLQVYGSKIYYTWEESDGSNNQIWTATSDLDGSNFTPTEQTTNAYYKLYPQLQVYGSKIYYTWQEHDNESKTQIWTATSDLDGSNFTETKQTTTAYTKLYSQLQVYGSKIYYVWQEYDSGSKYQIWTATSDLDGSNFTETKQTTTAYDKPNPQLQVYGPKIYYTWHETDGSNYQIWTATSDLDGSNFTPTKRTTTAYDKRRSQLQVYGSKIYYTWYETDGSNNQIWTATSDLDGSNFTPTKQTTTAYDKMYSQLQVYGFKTYYTWQEDDGSNQIWTANNWGFNQFLFKLKNSNSSNDQQIDIDWSGQASISSTTIPTITLQLYNYTSSLWENLASSNTYASGTDFTLSGSKTTSLSNYYDADYFAIARVTQGTREIYLETDYISATFTFPTITASGTVYTNEGADHIGSGKTVRIKVNGGGNYATTTDANGEYYIDTVEISSAGDVVTAYIDGETENAVTVTRATSTTDNITGLDLYQNRIIVRHEDAGPLTIDDLAWYDYDDDPEDILFTAASSTDTLTASSTAEFFVWTGKTFNTGATAGTLNLADVDINGTFIANSTQTINVSGSWDATGGTFTSASSDVTFTSTSGGRSITTDSNTFYDLTFSGSGGGWNLTDNATTTNDLTMTAGTATGTSNVVVQGGDATGNGTLNFTGGTFTLDGTGNFGGISDWTFYDLNFGDGTGVATTTALNSATTTVTNVLTIDTDQVLDAGTAKVWDLSGHDTPFVINGTFNPQTSTFKYSSRGEVYITPVEYYKLKLELGGAPAEFITDFSTGDDNEDVTFTSAASSSAVGIKFNKEPSSISVSSFYLKKEQDESLNSFTSSTIHTDSHIAMSIQAIDMDQDGDLDIVVGNYSAANYWYENDGSETFTSHSIHTDSHDTNSIQAIDLDDDGDLDIVAGNESAVNYWYENNGSEIFTSHQIHADSKTTHSIQAIDLDGDGDLDVVTGNGSGSSPSYWYENDGSEIFTSHQIHTDTDYTRSIQVIDLDGDGDLDIVAGNDITSINYWYENNGSQTFTSHQIHTDSHNTYEIQAIDMDQDGDLDIVAGNYNGVNYWYENNGSQTFTSHQIHTDSHNTYEIQAIDMDQDGDLDIVAGNGNGLQINYWYENDGSEVFTSHQIHADSKSTHSIQAIDLDQDGDLDILVGDWNCADSWYENDGQNFSIQPEVQLGESGVQIFASTSTIDSNQIYTDSHNTYSIQTIDLDDDGDLDIVAGNSSAANYWYENNGSETFTSHSIHTDSHSTYSIQAIDLDQDGDLDIVAGNWGVNYWYENNGSENFTSHSIHTDSHNTYSIQAIDLDDDGDIDIVAGNSSLNANYWYENNGSETFTSHSVHADSHSTESIQAIDLDQDGDLDIVAGNFSVNYWYENNGSETFTSHSIHTDSQRTVSIQVIDMDDDGDLDVIGGNFNVSGLVNYWYENNGSETFTSHSIHTDSHSTYSIQAIDLDQDGDLDIVAGNWGVNYWYENNGSENFTSHSIHTDSHNTYSIQAIDLDDDGDLDIVAGNYGAANYWYETSFGYFNEETDDFATELLSYTDTYCSSYPCTVPLKVIANTAGEVNLHDLYVFTETGSTTYTLGTTFAQTLQTNDDLLIGDGTYELVVAGDTYNPTINIDGDITINFSSTLVAATSSPFTIAGNWANSGTFTHSSGTTTFDGTATSTLSGATTFYNLSSITPSKVLEFTAGTTATTTVAGTLTLDGGACDTQIKLRSSVVGNYWYLDALASTNVDYVDVQDSDATYSASAITATNSTDSEHNVNWSITSDVCDAGSTLTASGTVYTNEGVTNIGGGKTVRIKVNGTGDFATTTASDGTYYIDTVVINSAGDVVTAYLDGETEDAVTVTRANDTTSNIQGLDLYQDYIIARHEDAGPLTIDNLDQYDQTDDDDILFTANATTDTLTASSTTEFFVWIGKTFSTGGAGGSIYLNDVDINGTFTATSTQTIYASSTWDATGGTFNSASSTVQFTSTVSGKTITVNNNPFWNLTFNGSGGGWTLVDNTTITNDLTMTTGTLSGTNNVTVQGGDATGNGTLNFTGGTFTLDDTGNFQGSTNWTFYNLNLGDGTGVATTTKTGSADTIISNVLTIANNQVLDAGSSLWKMTGAGDPFVVSGTLAPSSSDFWYEVDGNTNVTATTYHNLNLVPNGFSNPVFTLSAGNLSLTGNFNTGSGFYSSSVTADTHDPTIDIDGNFIINVGGNFTASREGEFKVGGNWSNSGAFTHSSGVVTFDATDSGHTIDSGSSDFGALIFNGSGGEWSPLNNTATIIFNLTMTAGTLNNTTGSANITVNGNVTGTAGIIDLTTNTFTQKIGGSSTFGTLSGSTAWTFNNLNFDNPYGSTGTTTTNAGTGAINVNGTTNLGSDSVTGIILENDTNNRAFNLNGNVVIGGRGALLSSGSTPLIIGGNYTNSGIFTHSNGTTTFDGTTQQTLSGSMIGDNAFYGLSITNNFGSDPDTSPSLIFGSAASSTNFYVTTASTKLRFQASTGYTFTNFHLNGQDTGTRVQLRSSTPDTAWNLFVTGTQSVLNTDPKDSDASGGDEIDATDSSNHNSGGNTNWLFGGSSLSFSISDNTIGFAPLLAGSARFATGDGSLSTVDVEAHTLTASTTVNDGYTITVRGATMTAGSNTITTIGDTAATSTPGSEQFGMRIVASGGSGTAVAPYNDATDFAYNATAVTTDVIASCNTSSTDTVYSMRYMGNIATLTEAGDYSTTLTYIITANF